MSSGISSLFLITDLGLESLDGSGSFFFGGGTFSAMVVLSSLLAFVGSNLGLSFGHLCDMGLYLGSSRLGEIVNVLLLNMGGVGGMICLVNSVDDRDLSLFVILLAGAVGAVIMGPDWIRWLFMQEGLSLWEIIGLRCGFSIYGVVIWVGFVMAHLAFRILISVIWR